MSEMPIRILLAGGDRAEARRLRERLVRPGARPFRVSTAAGADAALRRLKRETFDLALVDLEGLREAALDATAAIRASVPTLPVIALAPPGGEALARRAAKAGARACVLKGEEGTAKLRSAIRAALDRHGGRRRADSVSRHFETFLDHAPGAMAMLDRDMRFMLVSRRWITDFGLEGRNVVGRRFADVFPEAGEDLRAIHRHVLITGEAQKLEEEAVIRPDRSVEWIRWSVRPWHEADGEIGGLISFAEFVTDQRLARITLREREAQLRAVLDNVIDGIVVFNESGRVHEINKAAVRDFGYAAGAIIGENVRVLIPGILDVPRDSGPLAEITRDIDQVLGTTRELVGRRSDGSTFPIEVGLTELAAGDSRRLIATCRDITERKRMENMKSEFISMVSHELRTPLTSIQGSLGLVASGVAGGLPAAAADLVAIAANNSERLVRLINDILDIEKIEAGRMKFELEPLSLRELIDRALNENAGYAERFGVRFEMAGEVPDVGVRADRDRFAQVMANLLSNAAKFSPKGEAITVSVRAREGTIRVAVADKGPGVPASFRGQIFQRFAQADSSDSREKGGTGLGLAICKAIVERLGGTIGLHDTPGGGTTFFFTLPEFGAAAPKEAAAPAMRVAEVLVCESDPEAARRLAETLAGGGIHISVAAQPDHALELATGYGFDAIILNEVLDEGDGLRLIHEIRAHPATSATPVLLVSSQSGPVAKAPRGRDWLTRRIARGHLREATERAIRRGRDRRPRILHVEDDPDLCNVVARLLRDDVHVRSVPSLAEARRTLAAEPCDLVILDVALPDGSGLDLLRDIPEITGVELPVVIFSAHDVPAEAARQVSAALVKSRSPSERLLETVEALVGSEEPAGA